MTGPNLQGNHDKRDQQSEQDEKTGNTWSGGDGPRNGELHREPPFEGGPGRPLPGPPGPVEELVEVARDLRRAGFFEPVGDAAVDVVRRHARRPSAAAESRASASTAPRRVRIARCSRDLAVPIGTPRTSAASGSG